VLITFAALFWLWLDNRRAHEKARLFCQRLCRENQMLLLDDTVAIARLRLQRDADSGVMKVLRLYSFEFTDDVSQRHAGNVTLLGMRLISYSLGDGQTIENV